MTVAEWRIAQDVTDKPVKGMLTGPVTIVNWSFRPPGVPDDKLFWAVAQPIAQEVGYLVEAGARVIQVDEPAVRERWPLPTEDAPRLREIYARGVRASLNHVFNQPAGVQMHTHMCYGDFGDIVPLWSDAGVDVASIEFSRSKDDSYIRQFYGLFADGHLQIGPGRVRRPFAAHPGRIGDERAAPSLPRVHGRPPTCGSTPTAASRRADGPRSRRSSATWSPRHVTFAPRPTTARRGRRAPRWPDSALAGG